MKLPEIPVYDKRIREAILQKYGKATSQKTEEANRATITNEFIYYCIEPKKRKRGLILTDQTGVGKGRVVASAIRYAIVNDLNAIFVTAKKDLFADMYRDLTDIGYNHVPIFVFNSEGLKIIEEDINGGTKEKDMSSNKGKFKYKNEKIIFTTYSQFPIDFWSNNISIDDKLKAYNSEAKDRDRLDLSRQKRQLLFYLVKNGILILDEAHSAAGESSRLGEFFQIMIEKSKGILYSSATFAKRPDNLLLYRNGTELEEFPSRLLERVLNMTGLLGQKYITQVLTEKGQLIRRESDFTGINFYEKYTVDVYQGKEKQKEKERSDQEWNKICIVLRKMLKFEFKFKKLYINWMNEQSKKEQGSRTLDKSESLANVSFSGKLTPFTSQLDLSLKTKALIDYAEYLVKNKNQKVLITLNYTNDSLLDDYYSEGDSIEDSVKLSLKKLFDKLMRIRRGKGHLIINEFDVERFDLEFKTNWLDLYNEIGNDISEIEINTPIACIDFLLHELKKRRITCGEITGRKHNVNQKGIYQKYKKPSNILTANHFNDGHIDVLILNQAGSTGISLHASEKFKDKKQRHMIIAQAQLDINVYMQMLGRINRTGQTVLPEYTMFNIPIPVAKRFSVVLRKKLQSLNANTKADQDIEGSGLSVMDLSNYIGDKITNEFLEENPEIDEMLEHPTLVEISGTKYYTDENAFLKTSMKMSVLTIQEQDMIFSDLEMRYKDKIEELQGQGINFESTILDLKAKSLKKDILTNKFGESGLQDESYIEVIKYRNKINYDYDYFFSKINTNFVNFKNELFDKIKEFIDITLSNDNISEETKNTILNKNIKSTEWISYCLNNFKIGEIYGLNVNTKNNFVPFDENKTSTFMGSELYFLMDIQYSQPKKNEFPGNLSLIKLVFATTATLYESNIVKISLSRLLYYLEGVLVSNLSIIKNPDAKSFFNERCINNNVQERGVITGNYFGAMATYSFLKGSQITFSCEDGNITTGLMLQKNMQVNIKRLELNDFLEEIYHRHEKASNKFFFNYKGVNLFVEIDSYDQTHLKILIPRNNKFKKFHGDDILIGLMGDFKSDGASKPFVNSIKANGNQIIVTKILKRLLEINGDSFFESIQFGKFGKFEYPTFQEIMNLSNS